MSLPPIPSGQWFWAKGTPAGGLKAWLESLRTTVADLVTRSGTSVAGSVTTYTALPTPSEPGKAFVVEDEVALYVADDAGGYRGPFPVQGEATDAAVADKIANGTATSAALVPAVADAVQTPTVLTALTRTGKRPVGQGEIIVNVRDYGAKGDSTTDDTAAIRAALAATPEGGTLLFPEGYYRVTQQGSDPYILRLNRAKKLLGRGSGSVILLANNIPNTTDVILIQPDPGAGNTGYGLSGLHIAAEGSALGVARHALHIDTTAAGAKVRNSAFDDNIFAPTAGRSIKLTNPTNTDGFFTSRIIGNQIWSGIEMQRCGDSVNILQNTMAGHNALDVSLVVGSNTLVIAYNNVTCRGGIRIRSGHGIKIAYNNIEAGYADATGSNGALLDIDGSEITESWGLLAVEVHGNNFTYRTAAPNGIDAIRINKARSTVVDGNHIAQKSSNHIGITALASETIIGYNLFSSADPAGIIVDNGARTMRKDVPRLNAAGLREVWALEGVNLRTSSTESLTRTHTQVWDPKILADAPRHYYRWDEANVFAVKHILATQRRQANGTLDAAKTVVSVRDGAFTFAQDAFELTDSVGFRWRVTVGTDGALSTTRL